MLTLIITLVSKADSLPVLEEAGGYQAARTTTG